MSTRLHGVTSHTTVIFRAVAATAAIIIIIIIIMHGQLPRNLDEKLVDIEQSYRWLKSGDIKEETESTIVAAQDQAISTN